MKLFTTSAGSYLIALFISGPLSVVSAAIPGDNALEEDGSDWLEEDGSNVTEEG